MMGFIEIFPNLLAIVMGTNKTMSLVLNSSTELTETSGDLLPPDGASLAAEGSSPDSDVIVEDLSASVVDTTFYYIIFGLTLVAAGLGQIVLNQELHGERVCCTETLRLRTSLHYILLCRANPVQQADGYGDRNPSHGSSSTNTSCCSSLEGLYSPSLSHQPPT